MKKIIFVIRDITERGGIPNVVSKVTSFLSENEHYEVHIISLFKIDSNVAYQIDERIFIHYLFNGNLNYRKNFFKIKHKFKKVVKEIQPTTIIISGIGYFTLFFKKKNIHWLAWEHSCFGDWKIGGCSWFGYKFLNFFDELIVLTNSNKNKYLKKVKCHITAIPNPIDIGSFESKYDINSKKIISIGEFIPRKNFKIIPKIGIDIFSEYPDWTWHIYGNGKELDEITQIIKEQELQSNVIIEGYTKDVYSVLRNGAFFVSTALSEAFGMVLIEAQLCKLPIIALQADGPEEIISPNINGIIIPKGSDKELIVAIKKMISDENQRNQMSKKTMINFNKYSKEYILNKWRNLIDE